MTRVSRRAALRGAMATTLAAAPGVMTGAMWGGSAAAQAPLRLTVTGSEAPPKRLALPLFLAEDPAVGPSAQEISAVIQQNLESTGLFQVTTSPALASVDVQPQFSELRAAGQEAILAGAISLEADGRIGVRFRLWDVALGQRLDALKFLSTPNGARRIGHKIADVAYSLLTGEGPYFDSRVVFVEETGPKDARQKRLAIMDSDGANLAYLTSAQDLVLTPRFSPVDQEITFISYRQGQPQVYLLNLRTERQEVLGNFPGMTFAPRFSPDGKRVVMSLSQGGDTDIHLMELATRRMRRLTQSPGIDTAPSFSPDGSSVVFESDRGSTQQIYVMNADGSNVRRISFGEGRYATPVWSPRGDQIAFTKIANGEFNIGVMGADGQGERLLTSSYHNEGPTWAPNGRVIMFFRETRGAQGRPKLYSVDITGRNLREIATPAGASDPAWSPLIQ